MSTGSRGPGSNPPVQNDSPKKRKVKYILYFSSCSACLLSVGLGSIVVWPSPVVARLRTNTTENPLAQPITTFDESLIGSLPYFGATLGTLVLSRLCDYIGRKYTLVILAVIQLTSYSALGFAKKLWVYFLTRFMLGFAMGASTSNLAIFLTEISESENRGRIGALIGLSYPVGNLYVYSLGPILSIRDLCLFCAALYIVIIITFLTIIPDSPIYLVSKGRREEAMSALRRLRAKNSEELLQEYHKITETIEKTLSGRGFRRLFTERSLWKALRISIVLNMLFQLTGISAMSAFAGPLLDEANMSITGDMAAVVIGILRLLSAMAALFIIDKAGKKTWLMISSGGCGFAHLILGACFYLQSIHSPIIAHVTWLPIVVVSVFFVSHGLGLGSIVPTIRSELFPSSAKPAGVAVSTFFSFLTGIAMTAIFPYFVRLLGPAWCLWGFSLSSFLGVLFVWLQVPETKGKSVLEIQAILAGTSVDEVEL